jgi:hypothetical protein
VDPGPDYTLPDDDEDTEPCPAPWFAEFSEKLAVAEKLGCAVDEVDDKPMSLRIKALAHSRAIEKARPALEKLAEQRAEAKSRQRAILQRSKR